jgi:hypothetical protein
MRAVILDPLQADRRRLRRARRIDILRTASGRSGMNAFVPDLVRHQQGTLRGFADIFGEDRAALIVEHGARAFQRRIAGRQPSQPEFEMVNSGIDQLHGFSRRRAAGHLELQALGCDADRFERIHA